MDLFDHAKRRPASNRPSSPQAQEEVVEGTLERIVFAAQNGEFTVARLKVEGKTELETVVGSFAGLPVGARLRVRGQRESNPRFGPQLRVESFTELAPETEEGIRRYLGSGMIKGIGHEFATRIVASFCFASELCCCFHPRRLAAPQTGNLL
jgi:exodeoxyribonuclease V alpha subunit